MLATNAAVVQRQGVTMSFINIFHNCLLGKSPSILEKNDCEVSKKAGIRRCGDDGKGASEQKRAYCRRILSFNLFHQ